LVNTARGELVDEAALAAALIGKRLAGAASDVFVDEPPGKDHPLLELDNFIAMPHSAGQTREGLSAMGRVTADNALRMLRGEPPLFRVA
ncbi:MAG: NAD(P)-dependent oxidoreductase, partial [Thermoflexales bacterium]